MDPMSIRDKINTALTTVKKVKGPMVNKVARSIKGNIILTTIESYNAKLLTDYKELWEPIMEGLYV